MEPMSVGMFIFLAAWATAATSLLLLVIEWLGVWRFSERAFQLGPVILRESRALPEPQADPAFAEPFETANGSFRLVRPDAFMFRCRVKRDALRLRTPFPTRGYVRWQDDACQVEVRIPLSTTLFFAAWITAWTAGVAMVAAAGGSTVTTSLFMLLGWAAIGVVVWASLRFERGLARDVIGELEDLLTGELDEGLEAEALAEAAQS
jgi:hypothetical protein